MSPTHYSEDDLTLYYYGEGRRRTAIERHLDACDACRALYREIAGTLAMIVADDVPERNEQYGLEVWQRIRHQLPEQEARVSWLAWLSGFSGLQVAAAAAVLILAAFIAGRYSSVANPATPMNVASKPATPETPASPVTTDHVRSRILLASVADHLDRSERVLTDIMNVANPGDISLEQQWAEDLVTTSRLYRQDAVDAGEQSVATVLDDLERNLLEIVHSPSKISAADLEQLRRRIDAAALLFKVRVMSDQLHEREQSSTPSAAAPAPRTSKVS